jgi:hypothetical protein
MSVVTNGTQLTVYIKPSWRLENPKVDDYFPINYPVMAYTPYLNRYFQTQKWKDYIKYIFDVFMESYSPQYGDIVYNMTSIHTIVNQSGQIVITGIFKPYTRQRIRQLYQQSDASNKTWTDHGKQYLTQKAVELRIENSLYKICNEGELKISGLPGLCTLIVEQYKWS